MGGYDALNLYIQTRLGLEDERLLGSCTFPTNHTADVLIEDGCSILASTLPGSGDGPYNLGATTVHETGHWFGLLHTFEGESCTCPGDYVDDTKVELTPTDGCPASKDTCPMFPGQDPFHNYMDYSDDIW